VSRKVVCTEARQLDAVLFSGRIGIEIGNAVIADIRSEYVRVQPSSAN